MLLQSGWAGLALFWKTYKHQVSSSTSRLIFLQTQMLTRFILFPFFAAKEFIITVCHIISNSQDENALSATKVEMFAYSPGQGDAESPRSTRS